jgi:hypothetical protein
MNTMDVFYILSELNETLPLDEGCEVAFLVGGTKYGRFFFSSGGKFYNYDITEPDLSKDLEGENSIINQIVTDVYNFIDNPDQLELDL